MSSILMFCSPGKFVVAVSLVPECSNTCINLVCITQIASQCMCGWYQTKTGT
ncbi:hypothetical protein B0H10DRAFT_526526 [Mycena sp. CBHHK59/15]|nr:hypothetical protein B0H10DRAFT_526526 [Mycena sp. CBHHK59/15]